MGSGHRKRGGLVSLEDCLITASKLIVSQAVFQTLYSSSFFQKNDDVGHGILLTGKGYPDVATRELLKRLSIDLPS